MRFFLEIFILGKRHFIRYTKKRGLQMSSDTRHFIKSKLVNLAIVVVVQIAKFVIDNFGC